MRRYVKRDILNIIKTLKRATTRFEVLLRNKDVSLLQNFLADCQESAIAIGNAVEKSEGEGTMVIPILEEYCELLYQVLVTHLPNTQRVLACIERAEKEIHALPEILEVVFLPYKASMWDSLESVWMAAKEEENCRTYVVPIPYFVKNKEGMLGEMYYEGKEYPDYVPITNWQEYDLEKNRPDVVFIHNPYDECNKVTSVHPAFYTRNLKKYADKVVYIPYFVSNGVVEEHFCVLPGTIYTDYVIVQNEKCREQYVKNIKTFLENSDLKNVYGDISEKILALGSPKFDNIAENCDVDDIPEKWKKHIYTPEGKRKKIILYNTTIQTALAYPGRYLPKMRMVLEFFKAHSDKYCLLWRPHPLLASTLETMRPVMCQRYNEIVAMYKKDNFGIFDETSDMQRAIAVSDAYYGDGGSMLALYRNTGKPAMVQNFMTVEVEVKRNEE